MTLITIHGAMGSGKTTAAQILGADCKTTRIIKFADPLYEMQEYAYELIKAVHPKPAGFVKDRRLLQLLGTEWGRQTIDEELWVKLWKARVVEALAREDCLVICDDVRFPNELTVAKELGAITIKITRGPVVEAQHASEVPLPDEEFQRIIRNNGTLDDLRVCLAQIFD